MVQRLRLETGAPMMACKKALYMKDTYEEALAYILSGAWKYSMLIN